jgi:outer membrane protein TolC
MHRSDHRSEKSMLHLMLLLSAFIQMWVGGTLTVNAQTAEQSQIVSLSLAQAVEMALKNSLQSVIATEGIAQAKGEKSVSLSSLLPNLSANAYQASLTTNIAALGLPVDALPGLPAFVGPFNRFDARFEMVQSIFNLASIRRYQASSHGVILAQERQHLAMQMVTSATAISYLSVLESEQAVNAAKSNVQLAETLHSLAVNQKSAGVSAGIDVARAETRLASQQVQLAQAQTTLDNARLDLLRIVNGVSGKSLASQVILTDQMRFTDEPGGDADEAIEQALVDRVEVSIAEQELSIADIQRKAVAADWLPSISVFGDYGSSGLKADEVSYPTRSIGVRLDVPIFNGGRTQAEKQIASSRQREAEARLKDVRAAVEKDVRQALLNVKTREEQVRSAESAVTLATRELELAKDRFKNGVADNTEVVTAQTALENARRIFVSSLAAFNVARLNLASASGHVEKFRL